MSTDNGNDEATTLALRVAFYAGVGSNEEEMDVQVVVGLSIQTTPPSLPFPFPPYPSRPLLLLHRAIDSL